jgi:hypothetical protein
LSDFSKKNNGIRFALPILGGKSMSVINLSHIKKMGLAVMAMGFVLGCSQKDMTVTNAPGVEGKDTQTLTHVGDEQNRFMVLGSGAFVQELKGERIKLATVPETAKFLSSIASKMEVEDVEDATVQEQSLTVGYPLSLLNEYQTMGAVITGVSDTESESLGGLKLTDLSPIHVRTVIAKVDETKFALAIIGCASKCTEVSPQGVLLTIPILGVDDKKQMVLLDLASIAKGMNLLEIMDPDGDFTNLQTKTAKTSFVDYSLSTLVFDIEANMVPVKPNPTTKDTTITTRWYLRLGSVFNPAFVARPATEGVGFFMTERSDNSKIQRFSFPAPIQGMPADIDGPVKYYVKNVPENYKGYFKNAFDAWNEKFKTIVGRKLLSYEFVDVNDPRQKQLVPGDVRFNIVEWDLVNKAGYGGLEWFSCFPELLGMNILVREPVHVAVIGQSKSIPTVLENKLDVILRSADGVKCRVRRMRV